MYFTLSLQMMAVYELLKYVTVLLTVLVYSCAAEGEVDVNNVNNDNNMDKRSAEHFWKRDTEKSLESFWKRAADHPYPESEFMNSAEEAGKRRVQFLGKRRVQFLGKRDGEFDADEYYTDDDLDGMDKRGRQAFLGKRARQAFLGKRARQAFLGKRARQAFLGKRADEQEDLEPYLDEFEYADDDLDKRVRQAFLGKRARQAFLGKRAKYEDAVYKVPYGYKRYSYLGKRPRLAFLGKRSNDLEESEDKRARQAFLGKRSADEQLETSE